MSASQRNRAAPCSSSSAGSGGGSLLEVLADRVDLGVHLLPVLDGVTDVGEHLVEQRLDLVALVIRDAVDLEVHPRLTGHVVRIGLGVLVEHLEEVAAEITSYDELRVDHEVDVVLGLVQGHRHRVDQEGHVVGDHLHDRVPPGGPAVDRHARGEHAHAGGALGSLGGEPELSHHGAVQVGGVALQEVLGSHVAVERLEHRRQVHTVGWLAGPGVGVVTQRRQQFGLALFQRRHNSRL